VAKFIVMTISENNDSEQCQILFEGQKDWVKTMNVKIYKKLVRDKIPQIIQ